MSTNLTLHTMVTGAMSNNVFLIAADGKGLLIDAADGAEGILQLADAAGVTITDVLTTHRHADHVQALPQVLAATGATHYAPFLDAVALPAPVDVELDHGDTLPFAGHEFDVAILRGHTPGGAAVAVPIDGVTHLFVGDSLFPGGVGKTASETAFMRLFTDVTTRLFDVYGDDAIVHPGHGDDTTLGAERPKLAEWKARGW